MSTAVTLTGVPETMLWTLHGRAGEDGQANPVLHDPDCVRIYKSIDYDYHRSFGPPDRGLAVRAAAFDDALRPWLRDHPGGTVIELAAGLETQMLRCDDGLVRWLAVDVPDAVAVRERFLPSTPRHRCLPVSALDRAWFDEVDAARGVFVSAQGLFMYFSESEVRALCARILDRFPGATLVFDVVPRWFSRKTQEGHALTEYYTTPRMPWGVDCGEVGPLVRSWSARITGVSVLAYGPSRGVVPAATLDRMPMLRDLLPSIVRVGSA
ncbi:class I SAM-dependent methyltransferase [Nocardia puris]|uniref:Leucine carboxyl methyltransferase n=1 Tax=Nocardia puris TaxID=208602 RepID=A0A366DCZ6_9NOCA|nr:class I SAM-dependent methyltransferase [Nocardia puris]MBF6211181.1 class I SAM-dependent methyltransferase [Nocardia puris]MBF6364900.1 class I SAM-dependent methyltransferase [Nocardia puris]MBF6458686.1 class I SAM-dependent methyltransferase [Nocardia puris]RBO87815.1 leucine carboxyl methyltransferase [Nocardia puris]